MYVPTSTQRPSVSSGANEELSSCRERPFNTLRGGSSHDYDSVSWYDFMNYWSVNHSPQTSCRGYQRAHNQPYMHRGSETPGVAPRIADCGGHAAQASSSQAQNQPPDNTMYATRA
ncbi:hypothetical protein MRX96_007994 [Rhipicephalus microplus]